MVDLSCGTPSVRESRLHLWVVELDAPQSPLSNFVSAATSGSESIDSLNLMGLDLFGGGGVTSEQI